eukprot:14718297-Ditylum_brightwellii.AAC.1
MSVGGAGMGGPGSGAGTQHQDCWKGQEPNFHWSFSHPSNWFDDGVNNAHERMFALGSSIVDLSTDVHMAFFLPQTVYHCTSEP